MSKIFKNISTNSIKLKKLRPKKRPFFFFLNKLKLITIKKITQKIRLPKVPPIFEITLTGVVFAVCSMIVSFNSS